jgi:peptide/nickel transport system permease protein
MLLEAQPYMERAPSLGILPGAAIFVTALSVTMIGQGLELKKRRKRASAAASTPALPTRTALVEGESL